MPPTAPTVTKPGTRSPVKTAEVSQNVKKTKQSAPASVNKKDKTDSKAISGESSSKDTQALVKANLLAFSGLLASLIANVCLVWYASSAKVEVIAVTETGQVINPVPLNRAFVTEPRVLSFVAECLRDSFSHDFENYRMTLNRAMPCYTSEGGKEFNKAIDPTLLEIRNKRLVSSITTEPPALVRGPMLMNGRVAWEVETVMTIYYQGARERYPTQRRAARVLVVRVPIEENPRGIAIHAIQLEPAPPRQ